MPRFRDGKTSIKSREKLVDARLVGLHHTFCMLVETRPNGVLAALDISLLSD